MLEILNKLNNSKYFLAFLIIFLNLGSKFINLNINDYHKRILHDTVGRELMIFAICFVGTRDIITALVMSSVFIIMNEFMFNEKKILYEEVNKKFLNFNFLGSWSFNYKSWAEAKLFPVLIVKYEDLEEAPLKTLEKIIIFINKVGSLNNVFDREKATNSIKNCSFENLEKKEKISGFPEANLGEKTQKKIKFFNKGKKNDWKMILPKNIKNKIIDKFNDDLKKLNYEI